jgi:hypothetical protein
MIQALCADDGMIPLSVRRKPFKVASAADAAELD